MIPFIQHISMMPNDTEHCSKPMLYNYLSMSHHLSSLINLFYTLDFISKIFIHFANIKAPNLKRLSKFQDGLDFFC